MVDGTAVEAVAGGRLAVLVEVMATLTRFHWSRIGDEVPTTAEPVVVMRSLRWSHMVSPTGDNNSATLV